MYVQAGDKVKKGQKLLTYNKNVFKTHEIDETIVLVVCNANDYRDIQAVYGNDRIQAGDVIFETVV